MEKHTGASYNEIASDYARQQDLKPWNIYFERPGVLAFLPDLKGRQVLDAGCGPGFYSSYMAEQGAQVTALDFNEEFVRLTEERTHKRVKVLQADLAEPLTFASASSFDLVVCILVLHYLQDWRPTLKEFHRVLRPTGRLIFSTHHPCMDIELSTTKDYFAVELLEDEWEVGKVQFYRRPISMISKDLFETGFVIEEIHEPRPVKPPEGVQFNSYERIMKNPQRLLVRASKRME